MIFSQRIRRPRRRSSRSVSSPLVLVQLLVMLEIPSSVSEPSKALDFQGSWPIVRVKILVNVSSISWRVTLQEEVRNNDVIENSRRSFPFVEKSSILSKLVSIRYLLMVRSKISSSPLVPLYPSHSTTLVFAIIVSSL